MLATYEQTPLWRWGILGLMVLILGLNTGVCLNDARVHSWTMLRPWLFITCAVYVVASYAAMCACFLRGEWALWLAYAFFVGGVLCGDWLLLVLFFDDDLPKETSDYDLTVSDAMRRAYDPARERWSAVAGAVFNLIVFASSWRPRGAVSGVKLPLNAAATHVRPVLGEIAFNVALTSTLWCALVITRNDAVWDWCYMRDWLCSVFVQCYLCLYAACNAGVPHSWSIIQRLASVFVWPALGFVY